MKNYTIFCLEFKNIQFDVIVPQIILLIQCVGSFLVYLQYSSAFFLDFELSDECLGICNFQLNKEMCL